MSITRFVRESVHLGKLWWNSEWVSVGVLRITFRLTLSKVPGGAWRCLERGEFGGVNP